MPNKIQFRRGLKANLPVLASGEPGLATDAKAFYVGSPTGNIKLASSDQLPANVLDFGAKGDGVTDDTAAFQAALDTGRKVVVPWTPTGYLISTGGIFLYDNSSIEGENNVVLHCNANYLFFVQSVGYAISNFTIDMADSPAGSLAIRLVTAARVIWMGRISNIKFRNCYGAIKDDIGAANYVVDLIVSDCNCEYTKGTQVQINRSRGFLTFRSFVIDHTLNTAPVSFIGAIFEDFIGLELEKFDVVGPVPSRVTPAYTPGQVGLYIKGSTGSGAASVWLTRVLVDNTMGDGIHVENVLNLVMNGVESYQNLGSPMTFKDIEVAQGTNIFALGANGLTGAQAGANGITFNGCKKMSIVNLKSSANTGIGLSIFNSTDNVFHNVEISGNNSFGWYESGTSDRNIVTGAILVDNVNANLVQMGNNSAFNHWLNDGAFRVSDVGAITL